MSRNQTKVWYRNHNLHACGKAGVREGRRANVPARMLPINTDMACNVVPMIVAMMVVVTAVVADRPRAVRRRRHRSLAVVKSHRLIVAVIAAVVHSIGLRMI